MIEDYFDELDCVNDGRGTRYNSSLNTETVLTLTSSEIAAASTWNVLNQSAVGSDHYPVVSKVGVNPGQDRGERPSRWKLDRTDWEAFQAISEDRCGEIVEENIGNIEEFNERVVEAIM